MDQIGSPAQIESLPSYLDCNVSMIVHVYLDIACFWYALIFPGVGVVYEVP